MRRSTEAYRITGSTTAGEFLSAFAARAAVAQDDRNRIPALCRFSAGRRRKERWEQDRQREAHEWLKAACNVIRVPPRAGAPAQSQTAVVSRAEIEREDQEIRRMIGDAANRLSGIYERRNQPRLRDVNHVTSTPICLLGARCGLGPRSSSSKDDGGGGDDGPGAGDGDAHRRRRRLDALLVHRSYFDRPHRSIASSRALFMLDRLHDRRGGSALPDRVRP